jgi:hypothetical protein
MLKLTVAFLAVVLAGTASAAGWRNLRIDASSEAAFIESVAVFQDKLTPSRRIAFARSLQDIWLQGTKVAGEQQREYTDADYLRQVHGLGYEEVVKFADPTGEKEGRYRAAYYYSRGSGDSAAAASAGASPWYTPPPPPVQNGIYRGWTTAGGIDVRMNH